MMQSYDHFAYPLSIDAGSGAIAESGDYSAYIRSLVLQTVMTAQGERICRPGFGASIRRLVFAPLGAGAESFVKTMVIQALDRWLNRLIRVEDVRVNIATETLNVEIDYRVLARGESQLLTMEVAA